MSPYSGYNGQLLTSVYQPTEMALMHKGPVSGSLKIPVTWLQSFFFVCVCSREAVQAVAGLRH